MSPFLAQGMVEVQCSHNAGGLASTGDYDQLSGRQLEQLSAKLRAKIRQAVGAAADLHDDALAGGFSCHWKTSPLPGRQGRRRRRPRIFPVQVVPQAISVVGRYPEDAPAPGLPEIH